VRKLVVERLRDAKTQRNATKIGANTQRSPLGRRGSMCRQPPELLHSEAVHLASLRPCAAAVRPRGQPVCSNG